MNKLYIFIFSCACIVYSITEAGTVFSDRVFLTSVFIQVFSVIQIFSRSGQPYSLEKVFYVFSLFFFGISPLIQFYNSTGMGDLRPLSEAEYFRTNILIIIILILYRILYGYFAGKPVSAKLVRISASGYFSVDRKLSLGQKLLLVLISVFSLAITLYSFNFDILSLFFRGGEFKEYAIESTSVGLIISIVVSPLAVMGLLYYVISPHRNAAMFAVLLILALITCFPTRLPRFAAAALYIPLLIAAIPLFRKKYVFPVLLMMGIMALFPFLDYFRNFDPTAAMSLEIDTELFREMHFDSYHNFAFILSENIVTHGRQLLGVLLFWLPRSWWPGKPVGSGSLIANEHELSFDNISANFFAEGYINFGYIGILLFLIILAVITAKLDKFYWSYLKNIGHNYLAIIYYILIGMLFFLLRGDLLSSFAYTVGIIVSAIILCTCLKRRKTKPIKLAAR